jgi:hypothetical protein
MLAGLLRDKCYAWLGICHDILTQHFSVRKTLTGAETKIVYVYGGNVEIIVCTWNRIFKTSRGCDTVLVRAPLIAPAYTMYCRGSFWSWGS